MPNRRKEFATKEELKMLYEKKLMSMKDIAELFGVNHQIVSYRFKEYGINPRQRSKYSEWLTKNFLEEMYTKNRMSAYEISRRLGLNISTIYYHLNKNGVKIRSAKDASLKGADNPNWKGGYVSRSSGYRVIRSNGKAQYEHRLIMEEHLGRKLGTKEHVHHKNGNKIDNRIENLEVLSAEEHFIDKTIHRMKPWVELKKENSRLIKSVDSLRCEIDKLDDEVALLKESLEDMYGMRKMWEINEIKNSLDGHPIQ
jgi:DNA-binding CsgD family transcriptional regulator